MSGEHDLALARTPTGDGFRVDAICLRCARQYVAGFEGLTEVTDEELEEFIRADMGDEPCAVAEPEAQA